MFSARCRYTEGAKSVTSRALMRSYGSSGGRADRQENVSNGNDDVSWQFHQDIVKHRLLQCYSCATETGFGLKKPHCWVLNPKRREFDSNVIHLSEVVVGHCGVRTRGHQCRTSVFESKERMIHSTGRDYLYTSNLT